jgi:hypothetical protein
MRSLLKNVELEIGGQKIDKHYYRWQLAWQNLSYNQCQRNALDVMALNMDGASASGDYFYLPLDFWFCRNPGLALPLIALQYHEVKVRIELNVITSAGNDGGIIGGDDTDAVATAAFTSGELLIDYIYLDTDERRRFAQVSHEYLIEQVQFTGAETVAVGANRINLHFNHPVKELVWVYNATCTAAADTTASYISTGKLQLNGHDRFKEETGDYFAHVQRFQHHTGVQQESIRTTEMGQAKRGSNSGREQENGIYSYSFALKPEEHQPSGTCNFSRIDNAVLNLTVGSGSVATEVHVFAHSYNVLRVMSGMGGLAYSN